MPLGCSVRARTEFVCAEGGLRFGREPSLCARKEDFGSGENRSVCAERRLSLDDNICIMLG